METLYKVIIKDNLNRDYQPEALITMAMTEESAERIADLLNDKYGEYATNFASVVPADKPLNLASQYDLIGEDMPYNEWCKLTGANALPEHVAKYWYNTTIGEQ